MEMDEGHTGRRQCAARTAELAHEPVQCERDSATGSTMCSGVGTGFQQGIPRRLRGAG